MKLLPIGTKVFIGEDRDVSGEIVSIHILGESHSVQYDVEWWDGLNCLSRPFNPGQFSICDEKNIDVCGFTVDISG